MDSLSKPHLKEEQDGSDNSSNEISILSNLATTAIFYPVVMGKTLMQLGFEPIPPTYGTNLMGKPRLVYPNLFRYLQYIRNEDGLSGMYRGIGYHLMYRFAEIKVYEYAQRNIDNCATSLLGDKLPFAGDHKKNQKLTEVEECSREICCKIVSICVSYPLHVATVRAIAEFVGREKIYNTLPLCLSSLILERNFFAGLKPKLLFEIYSIFFFYLAKYAINNLVEDSSIRVYCIKAAKFLTSSFFYPFDLCANVMAVNSCNSLLASRIEPQYWDWLSCYRSLEQRNQLKRGASLLFRHYPITSQDSYKSK